MGHKLDFEHCITCSSTFQISTGQINKINATDPFSLFYVQLLSLKSLTFFSFPHFSDFRVKLGFILVLLINYNVITTPRLLLIGCVTCSLCKTSIHRFSLFLSHFLPIFKPVITQFLHISSMGKMKHLIHNFSFHFFSVILFFFLIL